MSIGRPPSPRSEEPDPTPLRGRTELARLIGADTIERLLDAAGEPGAIPLRAALQDLVDDAYRRAEPGSLVMATPPVAAVDPERIEQELRVARRIQRTLVLLTDMALEGWELASDYRPAREIGGDFFDVFPILDGDGRDSPRRLGIVMADVAGMGISAAILMAFIRPVMRAALDRTADPVAALERTNRILVEERPTGLFVTVLAAVVDLDSGRLRFANAGHEPPVLVPGDGREPRWVAGGGPLLGAFRRFELEEQSIDLAPGDRLVLYTDGIPDAAGPSGERFGAERLRETARCLAGTAAHGTCHDVITTVLEFQGDADPADDLALLVLRRLPA